LLRPDTFYMNNDRNHTFILPLSHPVDVAMPIIPHNFFYFLTRIHIITD